MKYRIIIFLLVITVCAMNAHAQESYRPYEFPTLYPKAYQVSYSEMNNKDDSDSSPSNEKIYTLFKERSVFTRRALHRNGEVYFNFPEVENLLSEVLSSLIPDSLNRSNYKVYAARSSNTNAYSFEDGSIYFNIGLLAELESMDAVALILGHELAHIISKDQSYSFKERVDAQTTDSDINALEINDAVFHRNEILELKADSIGFYLATENGYSGGCTDNIVSLLKEKHDKMNSGPNHPDWERRANKFGKYNLDIDDKELIQDLDFKKVQKVAQYENLELLIERNEYEDALEKSLNYHLEDKEDINFIYYAYENLRRLLLVKPDLYLETFTLSKKNPISNVSSENENEVSTPFDRPNTTLTEYREIEKYLESLSIRHNITESILTRALFLHQKGKFELRNQVLVSYIEESSSRNKGFADYVLRPHTYVNGDIKDAVILNDIDFIRRNEYGYRNIEEETEKIRSSYTSAIERMIHRKFKEKNVFKLSGLTENNYKDAIAVRESLADIKFLREILVKSKQSNLSDLFLLSPKHFSTFKKYGINAFEFIDILAIDRSMKPENKLVMTNPINWIKRLNYLYFSGSTKYKYSLSYYEFSPYGDSKFDFYRTIVRYKLTKSNVLNTVYQALKHTND